jgi:hypothetical protein
MEAGMKYYKKGSFKEQKVSFKEVSADMNAM